MTLPLTKTLHRDDLIQLELELAVVDAVGTDNQTPEARRWEYAMALRAFDTWGGRPTTEVADVGGAGSHFWKMLEVDNAYVIDPSEGESLDQYLHKDRPRLFPAVFCLSVLEHVDDLDQFLYHLGCLTAPGGLLFLTMDCWGKDGPDTAHFHWMRKRIFSMLNWRNMRSAVRDFDLLGEVDWAYHGDTLYGSYSVASLALVKRP